MIHLGNVFVLLCFLLPCPCQHFIFLGSEIVFFEERVCILFHQCFLNDFFLFHFVITGPLGILAGKRQLKGWVMCSFIDTCLWPTVSFAHFLLFMASTIFMFA